MQPKESKQMETAKEPTEMFNLKEALATMKQEIIDGLKLTQVPPAEPTAIPFVPGQTGDFDVYEHYKGALIEDLRKDYGGRTDSGWKWETPKDNPGFIENIFAESKVDGFQETIGALSAGSAIPEIWARDVFRCCPYPASAFWEAPYIKWHEDIHGKPGSTVHVITVGKATCGTAGCAEPASTAPTIGATAITMEEYQCSLFVCRDDLEDMVEDTITEINNSLASCLDECIDNAFIANLRGIGSTVDKGTAYITPAFIAETIGSVRNGTCEPVVVIMHPVVEARLMQNAQFVNASTYGDRSVITGGHILVYLGLDFVVVPKGSLVQNAPGTYHTLFLSRHAVHAAKKRDPTIETQYLVQTQRKYIYASVRFGKSGVCEDGIWWLLSGA